MGWDGPILIPQAGEELKQGPVARAEERGIAHCLTLQVPRYKNALPRKKARCVFPTENAEVLL